MPRTSRSTAGTGYPIVSRTASLLFAIIVTVPAVELCPAQTTGPASICDVDDLPRVWSGVRCCQFSSHDRGGGNYDSGNFLRIDGDEYVMLDVQGPGRVCRLWLTNAGPNHHIRVYLDGRKQPSIDLTVTRLFSGSVYPFVWPLVGNDTVSSGAYYCYVPIPFQHSCRITTDCHHLYYNVQCQLYPPSHDVEDYDPGLDSRRAVAIWNAAGQQPAGHTGAKTFERTLSLGAGETGELLDLQASGRVVAMHIRFADLGEGERALALLRQVRLRICWEGADKPAVDAPIGPFHCVWFPSSTARGLFLGSVKPGEFCCCYPMPFASRARIELVNDSPQALAQVQSRIEIVESPDDARDLADAKLGRFSAACNRRHLAEGDPDYLMADLGGTGVALGVSMLVIGAEGRGQGFLEGDERIFYDGAQSPQIHGTGAEDFFNGGYYFDRGLFTLPLHGYTARRNEARDQEAVYRLFLGDRIQYGNALRAGIEHGGTNDQEGDYESVFFYYDAGAPTLILCDGIDIGSPESEASHHYSVAGTAEVLNIESTCEGSVGGSRIADRGHLITDTCEFTVKVGGTGQVLLRRRLDYGVPDQRARVRVDGRLAGIWYDAGLNRRKQWRDSDFLIPRELTEGKTAVQLRIEPIGEWTHFHYRVFRDARPSVPPSIDTRPALPLSIAGSVLHADGSVVPGAIVTARSAAGAPAASTITRPDGGFELRGLPAGTYDLRVESARIVPCTVFDVRVADGPPARLPITVDSTCANLLANPGFREGFDDGVARGWTPFNTESYKGEFAEGDEHSQHIHAPEPREGDSYAGIWQKVSVIPSEIHVLRAEAMTRFQGKEENTWDNVMAKVCIHPEGEQNFRSRDIDAFLFPAPHDAWHALNQEVAVIDDTAVVYLTAWRKFPQGGSLADVWFRRASLWGPTTPPAAPIISECRRVSGVIKLSWQPAGDESVRYAYAVTASRNYRDSIISWTEVGDARSVEIPDHRLDAASISCALLRARNRLGVWSETVVSRIAAP